MHIGEYTKLIRNELKELFKGTGIKLSVRNLDNLTIAVAVMEAPFEMLHDKGTYEQLNQYHIQNDPNLTEQGKDVANKIASVLSKYHEDNSDPMIDYFDCNFYISMAVGKYDKPFKVVV